MQEAEQRKVYFASDMHFGSLYHQDPMAVERKFVRWLTMIQADAQALVLVGDVFDYWYEYKYVVPRGYTRVIGKLAELSDSGIEIILFTGNHDIWIFDYLPQEIGCKVYKEPQMLELLGATFFIAHGDEFVPNDRGYHLLQRLFRSRLCQFFYASIHPRWTVGFAHRWALHSRKKGIRKGHDEYRGEGNEYLVAYAKEYIAHHEGEPPRFFVFGHRHIELHLALWPKSEVLILGDWVHHFSYAVWDGEQMLLCNFELEEH
ncbi:MAG: UDP-2,3-diacylglucosamine diphosphatase [Porphyromonas sp.]|nr:UDP-2,3-diacylglucosamine diphosphatase [Porphyromonas sp.]